MWSNGMEKKKIASLYNEEKLLNPKAAGGTDSAGRSKESKEDMFDSKGQINAWDHKDVITQQQRFSEVRDKYQRKASTNFYSPEEKQRIVESVFNGNEAERMRFRKTALSHKGCCNRQVH